MELVDAISANTTARSPVELSLSSLFRREQACFVYLMAYSTGVESDWAKIAAIAFLVARLLYSVFYILNIPLGRSLMFALGSLCGWTLFALSILQVIN